MRARAAILTSISLAVAVFAVAIARFDIASAAAAPRKVAAGKDVSSNDDFQRSARVRFLHTSGRQRRASRRKHLFLQMLDVPQQVRQGRPLPEGSLQAGKSRQPANLSATKVSPQFIKEGAAGMPSFKTTLSDARDRRRRHLYQGRQVLRRRRSPPKNPWYRAEEHPWPVQSGLHGGAAGIVKIASGDSPEGIGVQLIAPNGIRTTVYTNAEGKFEFPLDESRHPTRCAFPRRCSLLPT